VLLLLKFKLVVGGEDFFVGKVNDEGRQLVAGVAPDESPL
jgi:hypothetical protein